MNEEILKRIDLLAAKIGVVGAHLWDVLVRQARIEAYESLGYSVFFGILSAVMFFVARKLYLGDTKPGSYRDTEGWQFVLVIFGAVAFFVTCGIFSNVPSAILNPEYWALRELIKK